MKTILFIFFLILPTIGFGQKDFFNYKKEIDTSYIQRFPKKWWARVEVGYQEVALKNDKINLFSYDKEQLTLAIGKQDLFTIFGKKVGLGFVHRQGLSLLNTRHKNQESQIIIRKLNTQIGKNFFFDMSLLTFKGLFIKGEDFKTDLPFASINLFNAGVNYILNGHQFSMDAGLNHSEIQKKTAHSTFVGLNYYQYFSRHLPAELSVFGSNQKQIGANFGLAASDFMLKNGKNWRGLFYANVIISSGIPFDEFKKILFSFDTRVSVYRHFKNLNTLAFNCQVDIRSHYLKGLQGIFTTTPAYISVSYTYRFHGFR